MVKINVNDFLDILLNDEARRKFANLFDLNSVKQKLDSLQATFDSLRLELAAKDAAINKVMIENRHLKFLINDLSTRNEDLQQKTKRDNLITTELSPSVAEATGAGHDASSSTQSTIDKVAAFCHEALKLSHILAGDTFAAYFLPQPKIA